MPASGNGQESPLLASRSSFSHRRPPLFRLATPPTHQLTNDSTGRYVVVDMRTAPRAGCTPRGRRVRVEDAIERTVTRRRGDRKGAKPREAAHCIEEGHFRVREGKRPHNARHNRVVVHHDQLVAGAWSSSTADCKPRWKSWLRKRACQLRCEKGSAQHCKGTARAMGRGRMCGGEVEREGIVMVLSNVLLPALSLLRAPPLNSCPQVRLSSRHETRLLGVRGCVTTMPRLEVRGS